MMKQFPPEKPDTTAQSNTLSDAARKLGTLDLILIENRATNEGRSTGLAYVLWLLLGLLRAHRFYLCRPISAILQLLLNFVLIGLIWTLVVDPFLIPGMVRIENARLRDKLTKQFTVA